MKLTLQMQLLPAADQKPVLLDTMERFNEAATFAAKLGFEHGVFSQPSIHKLAYREISDRFGLSSQMAVRAIGKAVECFKRDKTRCPMFKPRSAALLRQPDPGIQGLGQGQPLEPGRSDDPAPGLWRVPGRAVRPHEGAG